MTLRHMRIFQKIYETQSVTRAAEALHMTQPAVTRALQELEKYYGLRLFERLNRRLTVTEAGRRMYDYALHLTETFDTMEKSLRDWERQGVLRVGASVSLGCSLLPQLARTFQEEHPGVEVRVRIANGELLRRDLLENRLDLALLEGEENGADLMLTPFAAGEMALIVPPGHPLARAGGATLAQAAAYPLLLRETGSATRRFLDQLLMSRGLAVQPVWESASTQALLSAVREGLGITLVPWALARQTVLRGEAERCPVTDAELIRRRYVAWHPSKYVTGTMRAFVNLCMEQAKSA
ncbi:MAG TPA: LysR family transcriptional regulator [Candidatus Egerieenecus merdigallinarum]|jgi:DNA-binding transcriptional LysR family regulator|nr:LysR family transcriptional regulator [Candidatus Egerieenecus merdigallinarum]